MKTTLFKAREKYKQEHLEYNRGDKIWEPRLAEFDAGWIACAENYAEQDHSQLTKREYFAAAALQGLLANPGNIDGTITQDINIAVDAANKMIAALAMQEKENG